MQKLYIWQNTKWIPLLSHAAIKDSAPILFFEQNTNVKLCIILKSSTNTDNQIYEILKCLVLEESISKQF